MKTCCLTALITFTSLVSFGQNIGINDTGAAADASAILEVASTTKGFLVPRMSELQKNAIVSPAEGLLIYQTDNTTGFYFFDGTNWVQLGVLAWYLDGNAGTNSASNFIGTTDNVALSFRTNNVIRFQISAAGHLYAALNGSAAQPTYSFGSNTNTGMFRPTPSALGFSTNGTEQLRITATGNVGVGVTGPTQRLHVNGNLRLNNAFMPGNQAGTVGQVLLSNGAGIAPSWGPGMENTAAIDGIGKYYTGLFSINNGTYLTLDVTDANMDIDSFVQFTLVGNLPAGPLYGYDFTIIPEARNGLVRFHIINVSGFNLSNLELSYVAFY